MSALHRKAWATCLIAAALLISAAQAQTTSASTSDVKHFEILAVDGNYLVVRDENGTRELHVPSDFRFNIEGKSLGVADLKAGMNGTAVVTKTTTTRQVAVTEVKRGTVLSQTGRSLIVKEDTGKIHRFSQEAVDKRGIELFMDGKPVRVFNLQTGDTITARIVTAGPPEVLTQTQVDAVLAKEPPPAAPVPAPAAVEPEPAPAAAMTGAAPAEEPATQPEAAPAEPAPTPEAAPAPETPAAAPAAEPSRTWLWIVLVIVALLLIVLIKRSRDRNKQ